MSVDALDDVVGIRSGGADSAVVSYLTIEPKLCNRLVRQDRPASATDCPSSVPPVLLQSLGKAVCPLLKSLLYAEEPPHTGIDEMEASIDMGHEYHRTIHMGRRNGEINELNVHDLSLIFTVGSVVPSGGLCDTTEILNIVATWTLYMTQNPMSRRGLLAGVTATLAGVAGCLDGNGDDGSSDGGDDSLPNNETGPNGDDGSDTSPGNGDDSGEETFLDEALLESGEGESIDSLTIGDEEGSQPQAELYLGTSNDVSANYQVSIEGEEELVEALEGQLQLEGEIPGEGRTEIGELNYEQITENVAIPENADVNMTLQVQGENGKTQEIGLPVSVLQRNIDFNQLLQDNNQLIERHLGIYPQQEGLILAQNYDFDLQRAVAERFGVEFSQPLRPGRPAGIGETEDVDDHMVISTQPDSKDREFRVVPRVYTWEGDIQLDDIRSEVDEKEWPGDLPEGVEEIPEGVGIFEDEDGEVYLIDTERGKTAFQINHPEDETAFRPLLEAWYGDHPTYDEPVEPEFDEFSSWITDGLHEDHLVMAYTFGNNTVRESEISSALVRQVRNFEEAEETFNAIVYDPEEQQIDDYLWAKYDGEWEQRDVKEDREPEEALLTWAT